MRRDTFISIGRGLININSNYKKIKLNNMFKKENWWGVDKFGSDYFRFGKAIGMGLGVIILITLVFGSFGIISPGERGVKVRLGSITGVIDTGLYFKFPIIEHVYIMDVKTRTINYDKGGDNGDEKVAFDNLFGASKDLQDVSIGVVVNYHINPLKVDYIYSQYNSVPNFESNVIEPIIREIVKSTSAQYTAEELVTKRAEFSDRVNVSLTERLNTKDAILERFSVTNFEFSKAFTQSIEAKVTAVQNAEAARNKLEQIKFEAQQTIETAKAQAEAIRIQANAINSQGGADYVALQAIQKWNGILPIQMIPGGTVPFINLTK
jgi:regulator of protease activity HflC (stomatin/prohibitin superfamily)